MKNNTIYTILIVDDSELQREILKSNLSKIFSFNFLEANNGKEALKILSENKKIECIILDLVMPIMDGWSFLEIYNKRKFSIPIIVNSSNDEISDIINALNKGCYDYFVKPLKKEDLEVFIPLKIKNAIKSFRLQNFYKYKTIQFKKELKLAKNFQTSLLPEKIINNDYIINYFYKPFSYVGGDFIDYLERDNFLFYFIADISGHGVTSSMISSLLKYEFERYFNKHDDIEKFIYRLNKSLSNIFTEGLFSTGIVCKLDIKNFTFQYINCAHPQPFIYRKDNDLIELTQTSSILGAFSDIEIESKTIEIKNKDILFFYTDGIYEFISKDNSIFGIDNLKKSFKEFVMRDKKNSEFFHNFYKFLKETYIKKIEDDILLSFIKIL